MTDTSPCLMTRTDDATRTREVTQLNGLGRIALHLMMLVVCALLALGMIIDDNDGGKGDDVDDEDDDKNKNGDGGANPSTFLMLRIMNRNSNW